jgi:predicted membrane protein
MDKRLLRSQVLHVFLFGFTSAAFLVSAYNFFAQNGSFSSVALTALVWAATFIGSILSYRTLVASVPRLGTNDHI